MTVPLPPHDPGALALAAFGAHPVFVHAHPDDESISTGGALAALVQAGAQVLLVTGTRGERGEVVPGPLHPLEGTPELGPHRVRELQAAVAALAPPTATGTLTQLFLGTAPARAGLTERLYADSGMRWRDDGLAAPADDAPPEALSLAPLDEVAADLIAGIRALAPAVTSIVSYDAIGGYGHPDHVRSHTAARQAAREFGVPFYAIVEPRVQPDPASDPSDLAGEVTLELGPFTALKARAMAAHATQLTLDDATGDFVLSGGQRHAIGVVERYRRPADG
ncbi:PIG-L family deacetylase [Herbiconiux moechotypicola]|uniref:PIG-L family deacetylase n=1 Tax=Herbiconiux moechotypicola TaxID=637393 RepID=A0ABN3DB95_9MICO|nr:PIG-L family deacetylase [Herbiconiux moechotypicola]MCS5728913.1 PIG-L family deacetylase [Herbiconiux moechotypicola]